MNMAAIPEKKNFMPNKNADHAAQLIGRDNSPHRYNQQPKEATVDADAHMNPITNSMNDSKNKTDLILYM